MSAIAESSVTNSISSSTRRTRSSLMLRSDASAEQDDELILAPQHLRPSPTTSTKPTVASATSSAQPPQQDNAPSQPVRPQESLSKNVAGYAAKQASRVGFGKRTGPSFNISIAKRSLAPASQVSSHTPILSPQPSPAVPSSSAASFQAPPPLKPATAAMRASTASKVSASGGSSSPVVTMMDEKRLSATSMLPSSTTPPASVMISSTAPANNTQAPPPKRRHHLPHCSRRRPRGQSSQKAQEEEADCGRRSGANTPQTSCAATMGTSGTYELSASPCTVTATHEFNSGFSYSFHDPLHSASGLTASNVGATFMDHGSSAAAENHQVTLDQINRRTPPQKKQMILGDYNNTATALTPNSNTSIASWSSHCTECDGAAEFACTITSAGAAFGGVSGGGGGGAECLSPQLTSSCADSAAFPTTSYSSIAAAAAAATTAATAATNVGAKSKSVKNTSSSRKQRRDERMPLSTPSEKARIASETSVMWYQDFTQKGKQHQPSSSSSRNRKASCRAETEEEPKQERGVGGVRLFHRCNTAPIVSVAFNKSPSSHSTLSANSTGGIASGTTPDQTEGMHSRQISDSDFIPQSPAPGTTGVAWGDAAHVAAFGDAPMTSDYGGGFGFGQSQQPHHQPTMEESAMYRMSNECTASRLLPQLYLGGYSDTQYVSLMERFLVTRILSVAKECIPMDIEELDSSSTLKKEKVTLEKIDLFSVTKTVLEACGVDTRVQHQAFADSTNVVSCDHCVFGAQWIGPKDQAHAIREVVAEWNAACAANPHQEATITSIVNPALVLLHPEFATRIFLAADGHGTIFSTLHVPMVDHSDEDIGRWFEVCSDYIQDGACRGEATMVHCKMGISRSAAICMAYLMKYGIREKKVRDGFNFNLDTGGGRDLGYRGGRSLVKYRSTGTSSMLWNRTQTMGPCSPDTPSTDMLMTTSNNATSSKPKAPSLYQQVPQPNPLIEAVSKVGSDSRVWQVATSVISDMFFNCPECTSRRLVNVTYVNLHPLEAMQQYSRLSGASSLVSKSTSESFTGFVPVISNKKTVSDSLRRDLSAAGSLSSFYPLTTTTTHMPTSTSCETNNNNNNNNGGSNHEEDNDNEGAPLAASHSAAFLSIPAIQPRALCVQRGKFGSAATHSASLSVYMSTWGALQPTNNSNADSEPVSMMVSPSAIAADAGAVTRKKSFPSTASLNSSTTVSPSPPSIKAQSFHCHPTPMAKVREVADADMIMDTPPTSPTDPRDRLETMRDKRANAAEDRLPCFTDYEEALSFVKRAKEEIGPNFGFSFALRELNTMYGFKDLLGSD